MRYVISFSFSLFCVTRCDSFGNYRVIWLFLIPFFCGLCGVQNLKRKKKSMKKNGEQKRNEIRRGVGLTQQEMGKEKRRCCCSSSSSLLYLSFSRPRRVHLAYTRTTTSDLAWLDQLPRSNSSSSSSPSSPSSAIRRRHHVSTILLRRRSSSNIHKHLNLDGFQKIFCRRLSLPCNRNRLAHAHNHPTHPTQRWTV